jgi:CO dehydrogenase maturation factor
VRGILEHLHASDSLLTVTDMEAGLEHLKRGTLEHADALLIVVEPYFKSLEAAGRIAELARGLGVPELYAVANKVRSERDEAAIRDYCAGRDLPLLAVVPFDADVAEAERQGQAVLDSAPQATAVGRVRDLADRLLALDKPVPAGRAAD